MNILCICSYFKGIPFIIQQSLLGNRVFLITAEKRKHEEWPWSHITETFYLPDEDNSAQNLDLLKKGFGWLLQTEKIDVIVALDDFDVEKAAFLRSAFQIEGMDIHTAQLFRDKLAMRINAEKKGISYFYRIKENPALIIYWRNLFLVMFFIVIPYPSGEK